MDSLSKEYCAFTVAIVMVLHPLITQPGNTQFSPYELSFKVKNSEYGVSPDIAVNTLSLHQGFHLFKKSIRNLGHNLIQMGCKGGVPSVANFMDLPKAEICWDILFFHSDQSVITRLERAAKIRSNAHFFMSQKGLEAHHSSLSEISAVIWQRQLPTCRPPPEVLKNVQHKRRKSSSEISERQLSNCGKKIVNMVNTTMCVNNENPLEYLVAAIKATRNPDELICKAIFDDWNTDEEYDSTHKKVYDDLRVINAVSLLQKKNVTFSNEEKTLVLQIFDLTRNILLEVDGQHRDYHAALTTKEVLRSHAGYSELVPSSIERWNKNRGKLLKKSGHKVNFDFEASVWGKLMICEYEKTMVNINIISFTDKC